jgi:hypothetical protein
MGRRSAYSGSSVSSLHQSPVVASAITYKVEEWSKDDMRAVELLFAGNSLSKARPMFQRTTKHRRAFGWRSAARAGVGRMAPGLNVALTP